MESIEELLFQLGEITDSIPNDVMLPSAIIENLDSLVFSSNLSKSVQADADAAVHDNKMYFHSNEKDIRQLLDLLLNNNNPPNILQFVQATSNVTNQFIKDGRVNAFKFLAKVFKVYEIYISDYIGVIASSLFGIYRRDTDGTARTATLVAIRKLVRGMKASEDSPYYNRNFIDISKILDVLMEGLQDKKYSKGLKAQIYKLIGTIYMKCHSSNDCISRISTIKTKCINEINSIFTSSGTPEFLILAGAISCLDRCLNHFETLADKALLWGNMLKTVSTAKSNDVHRFEACSKGLRFIKNHAALFREIICISSNFLVSYSIINEVYNLGKDSLKKHSQGAFLSVLRQICEGLMIDLNPNKEQISFVADRLANYFELISNSNISRSKQEFAIECVSILSVAASFIESRVELKYSLNFIVSTLLANLEDTIELFNDNSSPSHMIPYCHKGSLILLAISQIIFKARFKLTIDQLKSYTSSFLSILECYSYCHRKWKRMITHALCISLLSFTDSSSQFDFFLDNISQSLFFQSISRRETNLFEFLNQEGYEDERDDTDQLGSSYFLDKYNETTKLFDYSDIWMNIFIPKGEEIVIDTVFNSLKNYSKVVGCRVLKRYFILLWEFLIRIDLSYSSVEGTALLPNNPVDHDLLINATTIFESIFLFLCTNSNNDYCIIIRENLSKMVEKCVNLSLQYKHVSSFYRILDAIFLGCQRISLPLTEWHGLLHPFFGEVSKNLLSFTDELLYSAASMVIDASIDDIPIDILLVVIEICLENDILLLETISVIRKLFVLRHDQITVELNKITNYLKKIIEIPITSSSSTSEEHESKSTIYEKIKRLKSVVRIDILKAIGIVQGIHKISNIAAASLLGLFNQYNKYLVHSMHTSSDESGMKQFICLDYESSISFTFQSIKNGCFQLDIDLKSILKNVLSIARAFKVSDSESYENSVKGGLKDSISMTVVFLTIYIHSKFRKIVENDKSVCIVEEIINFLLEVWHVESPDIYSTLISHLINAISYERNLSYIDVILNILFRNFSSDTESVRYNSVAFVNKLLRAFNKSDETTDTIVIKNSVEKLRKLLGVTDERVNLSVLRLLLMLYSPSNRFNLSNTVRPLDFLKDMLHSLNSVEKTSEIYETVNSCIEFMFQGDNTYTISNEDKKEFLNFLLLKGFSISTSEKLRKLSMDCFDKFIILYNLDVADFQFITLSKDMMTCGIEFDGFDSICHNTAIFDVLSWCISNKYVSPSDIMQLSLDSDSSRKHHGKRKLDDSLVEPLLFNVSKDWNTFISDNYLEAEKDKYYFCNWFSRCIQLLLQITQDKNSLIFLEDNNLWNYNMLCVSLRLILDSHYYDFASFNKEMLPTTSISHFLKSITFAFNKSDIIVSIVRLIKNLSSHEGFSKYRLVLISCVEYCINCVVQTHELNGSLLSSLAMILPLTDKFHIERFIGCIFDKIAHSSPSEESLVRVKRILESLIQSNEIPMIESIVFRELMRVLSFIEDNLLFLSIASDIVYLCVEFSNFHLLPQYTSMFYEQWESSKSSITFQVFFSVLERISLHQNCPTLPTLISPLFQKLDVYLSFSIQCNYSGINIHHLLLRIITNAKNTNVSNISLIENKSIANTINSAIGTLKSLNSSEANLREALSILPYFVVGITRNCPRSIRFHSDDRILNTQVLNALEEYFANNFPLDVTKWDDHMFQSLKYYFDICVFDNWNPLFLKAIQFILRQSNQSKCSIFLQEMLQKLSVFIDQDDEFTQGIELMWSFSRVIAFDEFEDYHVRMLVFSHLLYPLFQNASKSTLLALANYDCDGKRLIIYLINKLSYFHNCSEASDGVVLTVKFAYDLLYLLYEYLDLTRINEKLTQLANETNDPKYSLTRFICMISSKICSKLASGFINESMHLPILLNSIIRAIYLIVGKTQVNDNIIKMINVVIIEKIWSKCIIARPLVNFETEFTGVPYPTKIFGPVNSNSSNYNSNLKLSKRLRSEAKPTMRTMNSQFLQLSSFNQAILSSSQISSSDADISTNIDVAGLDDCVLELEQDPWNSWDFMPAMIRVFYRIHTNSGESSGWIKFIFDKLQEESESNRKDVRLFFLRLILNEPICIIVKPLIDKHDEYLLAILRVVADDLCVGSSISYFLMKFLQVSCTVWKEIIPMASSSQYVCKILSHLICNFVSDNAKKQQEQVDALCLLIRLWFSKTNTGTEKLMKSLPELSLASVVELLEVSHEFTGGSYGAVGSVGSKNVQKCKVGLEIVKELLNSAYVCKLLSPVSSGYQEPSNSSKVLPRAIIKCMKYPRKEIIQSAANVIGIYLGTYTLFQQQQMLTYSSLSELPGVIESFVNEMKNPEHKVTCIKAITTQVPTFCTRNMVIHLIAYLTKFPSRVKNEFLSVLYQATLNLDDFSLLQQLQPVLPALLVDVTKMRGMDEISMKKTVMLPMIQISTLKLLIKYVNDFEKYSFLLTIVMSNIEYLIGKSAVTQVRILAYQLFLLIYQQNIDIKSKNSIAIKLIKGITDPSMATFFVDKSKTITLRDVLIETFTAQTTKDPVEKISYFVTNLYDESDPEDWFKVVSSLLLLDAAVIPMNEKSIDETKFSQNLKQNLIPIRRELVSATKSLSIPLFKLENTSRTLMTTLSQSMTLGGSLSVGGNFDKISQVIKSKFSQELLQCFNRSQAYTKSQALLTQSNNSLNGVMPPPVGIPRGSILKGDKIIYNINQSMGTNSNKFANTDRVSDIVDLDTIDEPKEALRMLAITCMYDLQLSLSFFSLLFLNLFDKKLSGNTNNKILREILNRFMISSSRISNGIIVSSIFFICEKILIGEVLTKISLEVDSIDCVVSCIIKNSESIVHASIKNKCQASTISLFEETLSKINLIDNNNMQTCEELSECKISLLKSISKLYETISEHEFAMTALSLAVPKLGNDILLKALQFEAGSDYENAMLLYKELESSSKDGTMISHLDIVSDRLINCQKLLCQWEEMKLDMDFVLKDGGESAISTLMNVTSNPRIQNLREKFARVYLTSIIQTEDSQNLVDFTNAVNSLNQITDKQTTVDSHISVKKWYEENLSYELALGNFVISNYSMATNCIYKSYIRFLDLWNSTSCLEVSTRKELLSNLSRLSELDNGLHSLSSPDKLIQNWRYSKHNSKSDLVNEFDKTNKSRMKILALLSRNEKKEMTQDKSICNYFSNLSLIASYAAVNQSNLVAAKTLISDGSRWRELTKEPVTIAHIGIVYKFNRISMNRAYDNVNKIQELYKKTIKYFDVHRDKLFEKRDQFELKLMRAELLAFMATKLKDTITAHESLGYCNEAIQLVSNDIMDPRSNQQKRKAYSQFASVSDRIYLDFPELNIQPIIILKTYLQSIVLGNYAFADRFIRAISYCIQPTLEDEEDVSRLIGDIPPWVFLAFVPQLLGNLNKSFNKLCIIVLERVAQFYPTAVFFAYNITFNYLEECGKIVSKGLRKLLEQKCVGYNTFAESLSGLHHPQLRFMDAFNNIIKTDCSNKSKKDAIGEVACQKLEKLIELSTAVSWEHVKDAIGSYNRKVAIEFSKLLSASFGSLKHKTPLGDILAKKNTVQEAMKSHFDSGKTNLDEFSEWLSRYQFNSTTDLDVYPKLEVPGQYCRIFTKAPIMEDIEYIHHIDSSILVMNSKAKPKRIKIISTFGKEYYFLFKGGEDLRNDERIQQLFTLVNSIMRETGNQESQDDFIDEKLSPSDSSDSPDNFNLRTYKVVPITSYFGLLEWVNPTSPLKSAIEDEMKKNKVFVTKNTKSGSNFDISCLKSIQPHPIPDNVDYYQQYKVPKKKCLDMYEEIRRNVPDSFLRSYLMSLVNTSDQFVNMRKRFAISLSSASILGYLLGIGDRHLENILLDKSTGEVLLIDFGVCFGIGTSLLPIPELIPFRLTSNMSGVFRPLEAKLLLRQFMIKYMLRLKEETSKDAIIARLEIYLNDPVVDWIKQSTGQQKDSFSWEPRRRIMIARSKLDGLHPFEILKQDLACNVHIKPLFSELMKIICDDESSKKDYNFFVEANEQVDILLDLASNPNILLKHFHGLQLWI